VGEEIHVADSLIRKLAANGLVRNGSSLARDACSPRWVRGTGGANAFGSSVEVAGLNTGAGVRVYENLSADEFSCEDERKLCLLHPGSGSRRKLWPLENFIELAYRIEASSLAKVAFIIGPAELNMAPVLRGKGLRAHDSCDPVEMIALLKRASIFIGHDSGTTHLAAFTNAPTVSIFGPSDPVRWSPLGQNVKVLRGEEECLPCFETESDNCSDPQCLSAVSVNMVFDAVKDLDII
jgi:ADP-heptose:LPS heptosyltransferase